METTIKAREHLFQAVPSVLAHILGFGGVRGSRFDYEFQQDNQGNKISDCTIKVGENLAAAVVVTSDANSETGDIRIRTKNPDDSICEKTFPLHEGKKREGHASNLILKIWLAYMDDSGLIHNEGATKEPSPRRPSTPKQGKSGAALQAAAAAYRPA